MDIQTLLHKVHSKIVDNYWLKLFTAVIRDLLAVGFILPGLKKVAGIPFAAGIPTSEPIGYFFDAFFQATEFYIFIGAIQVIAGILLLFPATTALGTICYLPIMLNIFVITVAPGIFLINLADFKILHWEYFQRVLRDTEYTPSKVMPIVCERFEVVYPKGHAVEPPKRY